jgi:hypothetical protein
MNIYLKQDSTLFRQLASNASIEFERDLHEIVLCTPPGYYSNPTSPGGTSFLSNTNPVPGFTANYFGDPEGFDGNKRPIADDRRHLQQADGSSPGTAAV